MDLHVGGTYRYEWEGPSNVVMGMGGIYNEIQPERRIAASERFDEPWYPGEAEVVTELVEKAGWTTLTMSMTYESEEARRTVLESPMETGVGIGFDKLESVLREIAEPKPLIDAPCITNLESTYIASIRFAIPKAQIAEVMGPAIGELYSTAAGQGISPAGPWFTHHFRITPDTFDFEVCLPVSTTIAPQGRVLPGEVLSCKVVRTLYHGMYEHLGDAWEEFMEWISRAGITTGEELWERYLIGPDASVNPEDWTTELNKPIV
jgi:effector-binding domain-containing protein